MGESVRDFILSTLQKYGPTALSELMADCRDVGSREPWDESFQDAIRGLVSDGRVKVQGGVAEAVREAVEPIQQGLFT